MYRQVKDIVKSTRRDSMKEINDLLSGLLTLLGLSVMYLSGLLAVGVAVVSFNGSYLMFVATFFGVVSLSVTASFVILFMGYLLSHKSGK